jgi:GT2 family glycosyltransferase
MNARNVETSLSRPAGGFASGSNSSNPQICIVILAYNSVSKLGPQFIRKFLNSIKMQKNVNYKVIVVDNGSQDNTSQVFESLTKELGIPGTLIHLRRNYGWAGGNNRGAIRCKDSDYLFFLNDDTILLGENVLANLVRQFEKHKDIGAAQPIIVNRDGSFSYGFKLGFAGFMEILNKPTQPSYISGAALFTRTKLFFKLGMFDEDLFLYHDDVEYCLRLWIAGYKVSTMLNAYVFHLGGVSTSIDKSWYYALRNNFLVTSKISDTKYLIIKYLLILIEFLISWLWYSVYRLRDPNKAKAVIKGFIHGIMYYLPLGIKKRKYVMRKRNETNLLKNNIYDVKLDINRVLPFMNRFLSAKN